MANSNTVTATDAALAVATDPDATDAAADSATDTDVTTAEVHNITIVPKACT